MEKVVIVSAVRTPFGNFGGILKDFTPAQLGGIAIKEAMNRIKLDPAKVEEVALGVNLPGSDRSIARQAELNAGIPDSVPAYTLDRACCSSLTAIGLESQNIMLGQIAVAVAGGAENMSQVPYFIHEARWGQKIGDITLKDQLVIKCPYSGVPRALQAGIESVEFGISREDQDRWALRSQQAWAKAFESGKFGDEIVPVPIPQRKGDPVMFSKDEPPRPETTIEQLAKLKTVYDSPTVTPGNAPGLNTGASAVVLMSETKAKELGLKPIATIVSHVRNAGHPQRIGSIPGYTAQIALKKAGLTIDDISLIEINEAFAAMPLISTKILGNNDDAKIAAIREKTNVNGGAIAIGHPTGATGARLVMTLAYELKRRGGGYALATICGGIGEGEACIIKV
ncbi:MAG: acetyl-CoA C-acyltransferase [Candidatus Schekmanbacteria bacterium]|nr:acetyl-CoA C-acyltransferase [Candidatus Schekmanbacteria bacterium]